MSRNKVETYEVNQEKELQTQKFKYIKDKLDMASIMLILSVIQLFLIKYYALILFKKDPISITFGTYLIFPFIIVVFFNLYFIRILFLMMQLEPFKDWEMKKILTIWIGIVSLFGFLGELAAISDIIQEHLPGIYDCSPEFFILNSIIIIHLIFYILLTILLIVCISYLKKN